MVQRVAPASLMIRLLLQNPLLLLFVVAAIGYPLGRIRIWGTSLGMAGVLVAGLAIGSLHPDLKLPEIVYVLGLALFMYTVGPSSGPRFVASFRRKGLRDSLFVVPYNATLTLRQFGLILFLAGVGARAGYAFVTTLREGSGLALFGVGALITVLVAAPILIGRLWLRMPANVLIGLVAGLQTRTALLGVALEQTGDDLPDVGYTTAYPIATVTKIVLAQLLLTLLLR